MKHFLLLGAGFSKNWGGWLSHEVSGYLKGCPEIKTDNYLKGLLQKHERNGNFETALAELQEAWAQDYEKRMVDAPHISNELGNLQKFEAAISSMFNAMNDAFSKRDNFEFQNQNEFMVRPFLAKFDAIFTLNQDMLLEKHYFPHVLLQSNGKWDGIESPGMHYANYIDHAFPTETKKKAVPKDPSEFKVTNRLQPYFKLHGSTEWRSGGNNMLIIGADKSRAIAGLDILNWYYKIFCNWLSEAPCKLMIIGYGFGDDHINKALINGANKDQLDIFIIDPQGGIKAIQQKNRSYRTNNIPVPNELENVLGPKIIGESKRPLNEIFGNNAYAEHAQVMRFFDN